MRATVRDLEDGIAEARRRAVVHELAGNPETAEGFRRLAAAFAVEVAGRCPATSVAVCENCGEPASAGERLCGDCGEWS